MRKACLTVFCLSFRRDLLNVSLWTAHYNTNSTDKDEMVKTCDAQVACKPSLLESIMSLRVG